MVKCKKQKPNFQPTDSANIELDLKVLGFHNEDCVKKPIETLLEVDCPDPYERSGQPFVPAACTLSLGVTGIKVLTLWI